MSNLLPPKDLSVPCCPSCYGCLCDYDCFGEQCSCDYYFAYDEHREHCQGCMQCWPLVDQVSLDLSVQTSPPTPIRETWRQREIRLHREAFHRDIGR